MRDSDDTKLTGVTPLAGLSTEGHYVGQLDDGRVAETLTYEHAMEHHREDVESGKLTPVMPRAPRQRLAAGDGPAQVASSAYSAGYDRIFGKKAPVGEA